MDLLGVVDEHSFYFEPSLHGGFELKVTNDFGDILFDRRMILYTLYEAINFALCEIRDEDVSSYVEYVCEKLNVDITFSDD